MEKRNYVKPYIAVMNVQTEGVIAASKEEIVDYNAFCQNSCFSNNNSCSCSIPHSPSCENLEKNITYKTSYKCKVINGSLINLGGSESYAIHYQLINDKQIKFWPCNKK